MQYSVRKPTILLAGSTGTIGGVLLSQLKAAGFKVICPVREASDYIKISSASPNEKLVLDLCNKESVSDFCQKNYKIDVIISCLGSRTGSKKDAKAVEFDANYHLLRIGEQLSVKQ